MASILDDSDTDDPYLDQLIAELEQLELPDSSDEPLESAWHRDCMNLLVDSLKYHWRDRHDYYIGGNMCVYYSVQQVKDRRFLVPDVFVINGNVSRDPQRSVWAFWLEDYRVLDLAIELLSSKTGIYDRTEKKALYESRLRLPEYVCYDPATERLEGWCLNGNQKYQSQELSADGRLWSEQAQLWLGTWQGTYSDYQATWLRWFTADGQLCLHPSEAHALRADEEASRADEATRRAEEEAQRAIAANNRAAELEAEIQRLREQLASQSR